MTVTPQTLPHWDMSVVFPGLTSPEFTQEFGTLVQGVADLVALFDRYGIDKCAQPPEEPVEAFETVAGAMSVLLERLQTFRVYIYSFVATNSRDTQAQGLLSEFQQKMIPFSQLEARFAAWIGSLDVEALIAHSDMARTHAFMLRRTSETAQHLMSPAEEALAAELRVTSSNAWSRLHADITSQLLVPIELNGEVKELPMSAIRNLAFDHDPDVRRRAYEAELKAWTQTSVTVPLAAALNSIKGEVNALSRRRNWPSSLDAALFDNHIDRQTLDTMLDAARDAFPDFRRYLRAKAHLLGKAQLPWYDLFAPVGGGTRSWGYAEACDFIVTQFGGFSPRLRNLAERAFNESWIDAEPRVGKVGGAFCAPLRNGESRILANFKPSVESVMTLAHELGHAYHNLNLASQTMLNRDTPMTLAETASIFCETIIRHAAMDGANESEQLETLDAFLQGATQVVVDITSRFLFEQRVFDGRLRRNLSVEELNNLMLDAQRETYGDGLDEATLHPYMWAVKGHYYSGYLSFYNYPYMFGLLFGLGLYAQYQQDPDGFRTGYDRLLASTGLADAATLAAEMGIDIRSRAFWDASLSVIRADIAMFERLVANH